MLGYLLCFLLHLKARGPTHHLDRFCRYSLVCTPDSVRDVLLPQSTESQGKSAKVTISDSPVVSAYICSIALHESHNRPGTGARTRSTQRLSLFQHIPQSIRIPAKRVHRISSSFFGRSSRHGIHLDYGR